MKIRNGVLVEVGAFIVDPSIIYASTTYTGNHTVSLSQTGQTLVMNHTSNFTFSLPSVSADNIGTPFTFANINTGRLTIDAADSDTIADSGAGNTIYSDTDNYAQITLQLMSATQWLVIGSHGTWITT